jgi:hypothetical protein
MRLAQAYAMFVRIVEFVEESHEPRRLWCSRMLLVIGITNKYAEEARRASSMALKRTRPSKQT